MQVNYQKTTIEAYTLAVNLLERGPKDLAHQGPIMQDEILNEIAQRTEELKILENEIKTLNNLEAKIRRILFENLPSRTTMRPPFQGKSQLKIEWRGERTIYIESIDLKNPALQGIHIKQVLEPLGVPQLSKLVAWRSGGWIMVNDFDSISSIQGLELICITN